MLDNDELNTLKKKNVYRMTKKTQCDIKYIIILIIVSIFEFIIIIYLLLYNPNQKNSEEINDEDIDNNNINNINNINNNEIILKEKEGINDEKIEYKNEENNNKTKKEIHIAMALDNDNSAVYSTLVSMTSALENNDKNKNILIYHLLLSNNFDMNKLHYFESLKKNYEFINCYYHYYIQIYLELFF